MVLQLDFAMSIERESTGVRPADASRVLRDAECDAAPGGWWYLLNMHRCTLLCGPSLTIASSLPLLWL
jgi:hypothetical protein